MLDIAFKNMWMRRTRTLLTIISIAVCIMLFIVLATTITQVQTAISDSMGKFAGQMFVISKSPQQTTAIEFPPISSSLTMEKANALMNISGVDKGKSAPLLLVQLVPPQYPSGPPQILVVGIPEGSERVYYSDAPFNDGTGVLTANDQVVLGRAASAYYGVNVGDTLKIMDRDLKVVGIADATSTSLTNNMVMMPLSTAQDIFNRPSVTTVLLTPGSIGEMDALVTSVKDRYPELETVTQKDMLDNIGAMMSTVNMFFGGINAVMLMVAGVVTLLVMVMSVSERTKEIGMLRAIGASRLSVIELVVYESVIICLLGSALGIVLSLAMMQLWYGGVFFSIETMARAVLFMTIIGIIASLYPAYKATRILPVEALRYE
jgi:putative ABC transport system permease protein